MHDQVDEIKLKTDIVSVISSYVKLKKAGRNYKGLCPFHAEKTPSFMVSSELQIFKCFGCGESGDAITFLQKYEGMEFYEALKYLADRAGVKLIPIKSGLFSEKDKIIQINQYAQKLYEYILFNHKFGRKPLKYLTQERGLKMDTIKKFGIGYSPEDPKILSRVLIKKKKIDTRDLLRSGIVYQRGSDLCDRFYGRVVFPLQDHRGNIIGFSGRTLPGAKDEISKYINTPETACYQKSRVLYGLNFAKDDIKAKKQAIIVEGEFDLISPWQVGIKNIVAIKGSAFTQEQVRLLARFTQKLLLALDTDFAGNTASRKGIAIAQEGGMDIRVVDLKDYKDPDDMARNDSKGLLRQIENPKGVWDYLVDSVFEKYDETTGEGKMGISREIIPVLISIPDSIVQAHYIEMVAKKLAVPVGAVSDQVVKYKPYEKEKDDEIQEKSKTRDRRYLLEQRLMILVFRSNPSIFKDNSLKDLVTQRSFKKIIEYYEQFSSKNKDYDPSLFVKSLPKEVSDTYSELMLVDIDIIEEDVRKIDSEIRLIVKEIKEIDIKDKLVALIPKIKEAESENEIINLKRLKQKFTKLSDELGKLEDDEDKGIIL